MPRPFPLPLHIGNDICDISKTFQLLQRAATSEGTRVRDPAHYNKLVRRILSPQERREAWTALLPLQDWKFVHHTSGCLEARRAQNGIARRWERGVVAGAAAAEQLKGWELPKEDRPWQVERRAARRPDDNKEPVPRNVEGGSLPADDARMYPSILENHARVTLNEAVYEILANGLEVSRAKESMKLWKVAAFLAGRFAAKEAAIKAHPNRRLTMHDIWIRREKHIGGMSQAPTTTIISEDGSWDNGQIVKMSISHDGCYATAMCMAWDDKAPWGNITAKPASSAVGDSKGKS